MSLSVLVIFLKRQLCYKLSFAALINYILNNDFNNSVLFEKLQPVAHIDLKHGSLLRPAIWIFYLIFNAEKGNYLRLNCSSA